MKRHPIVAAIAGLLAVTAVVSAALFASSGKVSRAPTPDVGDGDFPLTAVYTLEYQQQPDWRLPLGVIQVTVTAESWTSWRAEFVVDKEILNVKEVTADGQVWHTGPDGQRRLIDSLPPGSVVWPLADFRDTPARDIARFGAQGALDRGHDPDQLETLATAIQDDPTRASETAESFGIAARDVVAFVRSTSAFATQLPEGPNSNQIETIPITLTITEVLHTPTGLPLLYEERGDNGTLIRRLSVVVINFDE